MNRKQMLGAVLAMASSASHAATWTIGTASAVPGQTVQIPIAITGDGITEGASIDLAFDEARLTLPVSGGEIPGANVGGQCARSTSKTVSGLIFAVGGVLPVGPQVVCNVPFTVRADSRAGRILLRASSRECAAVNGSPGCTVVAGWIDVIANPPPAPAVPMEEADSLTVLLRANGPSVTELVEWDYGGNGAFAPIVGLRQGVLRVRRSAIHPAVGDHLQRLRRQPDSPEAKSERYIYVDFHSREARESARELLLEDPLVESVEVVRMEPIGYPTLPGKMTYAAVQKAGPAGTQDFLDLLGLSAAWNRAGGWGLVGVLDNGVSTNHTQLRSFTGAGSIGGVQVAGGNYLPYFSANVGLRSQPVNNPEEIQPSALLYSHEEPCDLLDGNNDNWMHYGVAGHGTHVTGLVAANGLDQTGVRGACVRCGVAAVRRSWLYCGTSNGQPAVKISKPPNADGEGLKHLYRMGVQVVNMSFSNDQIPCSQQSNNLICSMIHEAYLNDVVMVAAAGNNRENLRFPAVDPRVASIGGLSESNEFWDESPGNALSCPYPNGVECGSNFAPDTVLSARQEVVAPAKSVRSTFYPGVNWSTDLACGDGYGQGPANDGEGVCTGTSMSAPELAGMYGLLRSINPVMRAGDPVNKTQAIYAMPDGIREAVTQTASRGLAGQGEDRYLGFGIPNADSAAKKILGVARSIPVRNRVTPLFGIYSAGSKDYATVATPQLAMAWALYSTNTYRHTHEAGDTFIQGAVVPGYSAFPNPAAGVPRARAMVLTTEVRPAPLSQAHPAPVALVLLEKKRQGPVSCDLASPFCHGDTVVVTEAHVQAAVNAGYSYAGLQGYIYPRCTPEATCQPPGTEPLHVKCSTGVHADCTAFLESERLAFEAAGYTANFLGIASSVVGYAYSASDADLDGMVDALERVVGTSTLSGDSDGDGVGDSTEYPLTMTPTGDPCAGPNITCALGQHFVFANGYE